MSTAPDGQVLRDEGEAAPERLVEVLSEYIDQVEEHIGQNGPPSPCDLADRNDPLQPPIARPAPAPSERSQ